MNLNIHAKDNSIATDYCNLSSENKKILNDRLKAGVQKTKITFKNHNTGEVLGEFENKIVISGSQFNAVQAFGLDPAVEFPSYNLDMNLDNSAPEGATPLNKPVVCLFGVADSGCGSTPKDVYTTSYTERIQPPPSDPSDVSEFTPEMLMPFRFVDVAEDIDDNLRQYYFGRKTFENLDKIGYYFKSFDSDPELHLRYADGTQITDAAFNVESEQSAECYVEMRLRITRLDLRDYFEQVIGWDKARISSLTLLYAWYDTTIDEYRYYQDIIPYSVLHFSYMSLISSDVAIDIIYDVYY